MQIRMPLIFIGYDERRLFSVSDERGRVFIPVFMSAQLAEMYRKHFDKHVRREDETASLMTLMVEEVEKAINLLQWIQLVDPAVERIAIDPDTPTLESEKALCPRIPEFLDALVEYQETQGQKDRNRRHPRNGRVK